MAKKRIFLAGPTREILNVKDLVTFLARVANQNAGFTSSFQLAVSAINHFHRDHNASYLPPSPKKLLHTHFL